MADKTDKIYEKILKSLESAGKDFDEFGDNDKKDIDRNFEVPSVKPERKATEDWGDDVLSINDLLRIKAEDEAGLTAKTFKESKATEDWDDVISMKDLIRMQEESDGIYKGKSALEGRWDEEEMDFETPEDNVKQASYDDMMNKKSDLDANPFVPHGGMKYQQGGEIDLDISEEGDGYEEPYGALLEDAKDEDDDEDFGFEAFKDGDLEDPNPEFKEKADYKGGVDMNADMEGVNSRKFWDEAITSEDDEDVRVGYNPSPNAELEMPKADFKKKRPSDDLEGIESYEPSEYQTWKCMYCDASWEFEVGNQQSWNNGNNDRIAHYKDVHKITTEALASEDGYSGYVKTDDMGEPIPDQKAEWDNMSGWQLTPEEQRLLDTGISVDEAKDEGSMGDIWNCPECGFKTASKDEFDDHNQSHSNIPADTGESIEFEDLGKDDDILAKFRNE